MFVVYMPNEDRENSEASEPVSPTPELLPKVNSSGKKPDSHDDGGGENGIVPEISIDIGDDDEVSMEKPLLSNACGDGSDQISSASSDKPVDDDKCVTKHQSLSTLDTDKPIPRRSSENVLTMPEKALSDMKGGSDSVVYREGKVRFQVTKLDTPDTDGEKQSVTELAASVTELAADAKEEKKPSLIPTEEADVVMERLTLKEVG